MAAFFLLFVLKVRKSGDNSSCHGGDTGHQSDDKFSCHTQAPFIPVFRPRPVEFGRQPPEGVRAFQWFQYSMVYLCCEVGMACFGVGFSGMEVAREAWRREEELGWHEKLGRELGMG